MSVHRAFKGTERAVARLVGGQRLGHLGGTDVQSDWLACEVKHRQSLPAWLTDAVAQAKRHAQGERLPVAILHVEGTRHASDLVVLHLSDFIDHFGPIEQPMEK